MFSANILHASNYSLNVNIFYRILFCVLYYHSFIRQSYLNIKMAGDKCDGDKTLCR
jgi:hypothetical protein